MRRAGDTLFSTRKGAKPMNNMTWLDLYLYLHEQANSIKKCGDLDWQSAVIIHDADTGDEFTCDTFIISDNRGFDRLTLTINTDKIFSENSERKA